jgi:ParB family chromosome partitioning protein
MPVRAHLGLATFAVVCSLAVACLAWTHVRGSGKPATEKREVGAFTAVSVASGIHAEIALVENLLRQDLTAVEEAEALQRLADEQKYTQDQLSGIIGKARNTISEILSLNRLPQEIRDECRGNAAVPRKTLIEISRKKQARAMTTEWSKYKEKLQKQQEGRTKKKKTEETPEQTFEWLSKFTDQISVLDASAWTDENKNVLHDLLVALDDAIQTLLEVPEPTPAPEPGPTPSAPAPSDPTPRAKKKT